MITPLNHVNSSSKEIAEHLYVGSSDGGSSLRVAHLRSSHRKVLDFSSMGAPWFPFDDWHHVTKWVKKFAVAVLSAESAPNP